VFDAEVFPTEVFPSKLFPSQLFGVNLTGNALEDTINFTDFVENDNQISASLSDTLIFTENAERVYPLPSILAGFLTGNLFDFTESQNIMQFGNNPKGRNCKNLSNQAEATGLDTTAGFSIPFIMINPQILLIENANNLDFYNGAQITLYNLVGGTGSTTVAAIINNVSIDLDNTYITFALPVTNHTSGLIALNDDSQAVATGYSTIASAHNSMAGGRGAVADIPGQFARSDSYYNTPGDGQYSFTSATAVTVNNTPVIMFADGKYLTIRKNMTYAFIILLSAKQVNGNNSALFLRYGILQNISGTVSLNGVVQTLGVDINTTDWSVNITADDINDALQIQCLGDNSSIIHWKARIDTIEIG
jgi:hypothetical protein